MSRLKLTPDQVKALRAARNQRYQLKIKQQKNWQKNYLEFMEEQDKLRIRERDLRDEFQKTKWLKSANLVRNQKV